MVFTSSVMRSEQNSNPSPSNLARVRIRFTSSYKVTRRYISTIYSSLVKSCPDPIDGYQKGF